LDANDYIALGYPDHTNLGPNDIYKAIHNTTSLDKSNINLVHSLFYLGIVPYSRMDTCPLSVNIEVNGE
jgi:hypothetical protein